MAEEVEKIRLDKISLSQLFNENFVNKLEELKEEILLNAVILMKTKNNVSIPLIISHQNKKEIDGKIVHIESPDSDFLNEVKEIIQKL